MTTTLNFRLNATPAGNTITYIYDPLGRLVGVVDPAGDAARYNYDAVGNLLSIARQSASITSIIQFTPPSGLPGTVVTLYGSGFSPIPNQNTVQFNGTAATVSSATATQIITSVPAGATSGPISVTTPGGSATTSTAFTVTTTTAAPTITGFNPSIGTPGTPVTISGTNFDTTPSRNNVSFNGTLAIASSSTTNSIATTVPQGGSGHISVSTVNGQAVSSGDFFIPPSPYSSAQVAVTGRMAIGDTKTITLNTANTIAMILFDGNAGQRVSWNLNSTTISGGSAYVYNPDGTLLAGSYFSSSPTSGSFAMTLAYTGTYAIVVAPTPPNTGGMTFSISTSVDLTGTITPGGPSVTVNINIPGQYAYYTFSGTAGQQVSLNVTNLTIPDTTSLCINKPDGTSLSCTRVFAPGGFLDTVTLPSAATSTVAVRPQNQNTGSLTLTLYNVMHITGPITPNGPPVNVNITTPGQNAYHTFSGTAGQLVSLYVTGLTIPGTTNVCINKPDGTSLACSGVAASGGVLDTVALPSTATYTAVLDPSGPNIGNAILTLVIHVTGSITPSGPPVNVNITIPGQNAYYTFSGTAGQRVSLNVTNLTIPGTTSLCINKPDGTSLACTGAVAPSGFLDTVTLPVAAIYTVAVRPQNFNTGSATLTLYNVVHLTGTITPGGPPVTVNITIPGQNAYYTFSGIASQRVSLNVTNMTIPDNVDVCINKPDGTSLACMAPLSPGGLLDTMVLPSTGTYTIVVDPRGAATGTATLTLYNVVHLTGTITPGGPPVNVAITIPGQNAYYTFSGTAGQRVSLNVTNLVISDGNNVDVCINNSSGASLACMAPIPPGGFLDTVTLPAADTYTVAFDPRGPSTGTATLTLYNVVHVTGTITPGGPPVNVNITTPGQNAYYTFSGTTGQRVSLNVTNLTISDNNVDVCINNPDGSALSCITPLAPGGFLNTVILPVTGTYTVSFDPRGPSVGSATLTLYSVVDVAGTLTIGGPAFNVNITTPGQNARITFSGTSGQPATVQVTNNTISWMTVTLFNPDGTVLTSGTAGASSFDLPSQTLPATGTYTIWVAPDQALIGSLSLSVSSP